MKPIYITDRTRIVTREECERKRYLQFDYDINGEPIGLQRKTGSLPLLNGIEIHEAHAKLLAGQSLDSIVQEMRASYSLFVANFGIHGEVDPDQLVKEQMALIEGMLRAFSYVWLPRILDEYDVLDLEKPRDWVVAPGLVQKLRFDTRLRRKGDGQLVIMDWKSMSYISDAWAKKLEHSRQSSLYIEAAEEIFDEPVEIAYLGMVKGMYRTDTAKASPWYNQKIQSSPYLYAYELQGDVGNVYQTEWTNKKGFKKIRTYEQMSMKEWIDHLWHNERQTLNELFTFNPPFAPTKAERLEDRQLVIYEELKYHKDLDIYKARRDKAVREGDELSLNKAEEFLNLVVAPKRKERCYQYGEANVCPMYELCHVEGALERVLEDGAYEPRVPHHSQELEEAA